MVWQRINVVMLAGCMASLLALPLRADDGGSAAEKVPAPAAPAVSSGCGDTQYVTVRSYEWVPETHMVKKTCYKTECREETYTACKTECVAEQRTRCVTCKKLVPECREETVCVKVRVPYTEERTVYENRTTCKEVCETVKVCKDCGHWECCEELSLLGKLQERLANSRRHHGCGDACGSCGGCETSCTDSCKHYNTRTVRHWVSNKVWEEKQVKKIVKCHECVPVKKCVTCYRCETRQEVRKKTCYKTVCETRNETYTVLVPHKVSYQATRKVNVRVPYCVEVPVTTCVKKCVEKKVACTPVSSCNTCESSYREHRGFRLLHREHSCDCCR